jgi:hypothetical protein
MDNHSDVNVVHGCKLAKGSDDLILHVEAIERIGIATHHELQIIYNNMTIK